MLRRSNIAATGVLVCFVVAVPAWPTTITVIPQPSSFNYTNVTTLIDISGLEDREATKKIESAQGGGLTVNFSAPLNDWAGMVRLTIPLSWAGWGAPPAAEKTSAPCLSPLLTQCPLVLWSKGPSQVTMTLSTPESVFGFDAEPNNPAAELMTATFYGAGGQLGSISLMPSGYFGARLFAASSTTPFTKVVLSNASNHDFAIANVRFSPTPLPEPTPVLLVGIGLFGLGLWKVRRLRHVRGAAR